MVPHFLIRALRSHFRFYYQADTMIFEGLFNDDEVFMTAHQPKWLISRPKKKNPQEPPKITVIKNLLIGHSADPYDPVNQAAVGWRKQ